MALGPIEVLVVAFPGNRFTGEILPELDRLVGNDTITVVDGLFATKDADGEVDFLEFEQIDAASDAAALSAYLDEALGLLSDDDVAELTASLEPNSSAAILVFEHTWAKPLRDAIVNSGGLLIGNLRIPGFVVDEVLEGLEVS